MADSEISVKELRVEGVTFGFGGGVEALAGVTFSAKAGEIVAVVGPNGCGKTTLLRVMGGELRAGGGRVMLDGADVAGMTRVEAARRMAVVPQGASASSGAFAYTVREMVMMGRYARQAGRGGLAMETETDLAAADAAMWAADVHHLAERAVTALSGGERQRVAIARALAQETPVLLLDEPTAALDLFHVFDVLEHVRELARGGRIVLLVTHDLRMAQEWADRAVVMDGGRVVAAGPVGEVFTPEVLEGVYHVKVERGAGGELRFSRRVR